MKQNYRHRHGGVNPRTGHTLPKWQQVQVEDPTLPAWRRVKTHVDITTEAGRRPLELWVYTRQAGGPTPEEAAKEAKALGFVPAV